jgi:hypothetical protein
MNPTIDMTAAVRPYAKRLASHAVGSGKVSMNQSWKTGGNLYKIQFMQTVRLGYVCTVLEFSKQIFGRPPCQGSL